MLKAGALIAQLFKAGLKDGMKVPSAEAGFCFGKGCCCQRNGMGVYFDNSVNVASLTGFMALDIFFLRHFLTQKVTKNFRPQSLLPIGGV